MEPQQIQIIDLMAQNETVLSDLYKNFSEKYPETAEFWLNLANDELTHGRWLKSLIPEINRGNLSFQESRFNQKMVFDFLQGVRESLKKAERQERMPLLEALALSLAIEKSMLEKDFFKAVETDQLALKEVLLNLAQATVKHVQKIEEMLKNYANFIST